MKNRAMALFLLCMSFSAVYASAEKGQGIDEETQERNAALGNSVLNIVKESREEMFKAINDECDQLEKKIHDLVIKYQQQADTTKNDTAQSSQETSMANEVQENAEQYRKKVEARVGQEILQSTEEMLQRIIKNSR